VEERRTRRFFIGFWEEKEFTAESAEDAEIILDFGLRILDLGMGMKKEVACGDLLFHTFVGVDYASTSVAGGRLRRPSMAWNSYICMRARILGSMCW
jgi:hypothetical protein